MKARIFLLIALYLVGFSSLFSTNYYVSNSGDDTKDGKSPANAWKTLAKVESMQTQYKPGDVIAFKGGDKFYGKLVFNRLKGEEGNPITFTSYGEGKAVITGSRSQEGWLKSSENIWESVISENVLNVFRADSSLTNARTPRIVGKYRTLHNQYRVSSVVNPKNSFICKDLIGAGDLVGATIHFNVMPWILQARTISSFDNSTGEVTVTPDFDYLGQPIRTTCYFFINNAFNFLTEEGEWYYDSTKGKLFVYSQMIPTNITVTTSDNTGVMVTSSSFFVFDRLVVRDYNINGFYLASCSNYSITNCDLLYNYVDGIYARDGSFGVFSKNVFVGSQKNGLFVYDEDCHFTYNKFFEIGLMKNMSPKGFLVGNGMDSYSDNAIITNNEFYDMGNTGLAFNGKNSLVQYNWVQYSQLTVNDGGAIYTYDNGSRYSIVKNNIAMGHPLFNKDGFDWHSHGIYCDGGSEILDIKENTLINFYTSISLVGNKSIKVFSNNIYNPHFSGILSWTTVRLATLELDTNRVYFNKVLLSNANASGASFLNSTESVELVRSNNYDYNTYYNLYSFNEIAVYATGFKEHNNSIKRLDLKNIQQLVGIEKNSHESDKFFKNYLLDSISGANIFPNGDFSRSNINEWTAWNSVKSCVTRNDQPENYCLKMSYNGNNNYGKVWAKTTSALQGGKKYLLNYEIRSDSTFRTAVSIQNQDGTLIVNNQLIYVTNEWNKVSIPFSPTSDQGYVNISFTKFDVEASIYIDNIQVVEADYELITPYQIIYNNTMEIMTTNLDGFWVDMDNNLYETVVLQPFTSVMLLKADKVSHKLQLNEGWNIISFQFMPETSKIEDVMSNLIKENRLVKIQDEKGNSFEKSGVDNYWIDNLEKMSVNKAYRVKVTSPCIFYYKGFEFNKPEQLPLSKGWSLLPFSFDSPKNGLFFLKTLIDEGTLLEVRDEMGKMIYRDDNGEWINEIGDFSPGKGYEIKVSKNTTFVVPDK